MEREKSPSVRDDDLLLMLDNDELWIIRHKTVDRETSLRRAFMRAADLAAAGNYIFAIRTLDDRIVIGPIQVRRLFKELGIGRSREK
jgi:hypothetical protein